MEPPFSGQRWPGHTISFGFPDLGFRWGDVKADDYDQPFDADWSPLGEEDRTVERAVSQAIASATGLTFVEVLPKRAQIRIARSTKVKSWGYAFSPGTRSRRSGAIFHHPDISGEDNQPGSRVFAHRLHESFTP